MMEELVEKRPEIIREATTDVGWTPFHCAAAYGGLDAVKILLKYDISSAAYILDHDGNSALHIAAFERKINVIKVLIQSCPDIFELTNKKSQTALHLAILSNQVFVVAYILGNSRLAGLLNEPDEDGNTPLHSAVLYDNFNLKVIEMLTKDTRVNINATNKEFKSAYDIYLLHCSEVRNVFVQYGFKKTWIESLLKGSSRALSKEHLNRRPELKPLVSGFRERWEQHKDSYLKFPEVFLIVATLVTTVSFSAAFQVPAGYITDGAAKGNPILAEKAAFKAFVIFDIVSFFSSLSAIYFQGCAAFSEQIRARYEKFQLVSLGIAILALALAFASGIYVILADSNRALATAPYVMVCGLLFIYNACTTTDLNAVDPLGLGLRIIKMR